MKIAAFYNVKGGVGKTASCVNISYLCALEGRKTLLWDLDSQGGSTFYLGENISRVKKLKKVIKDGKQFEALIKASPYANLDIIPADFNFRYMDILLDDDKKSEKRFAKLTQKIQDRYEYLFLDCPPSLSTLSETIFKSVDFIVTPVIPTTLSMQSLDQFLDYLEEQGGDPALVLPFFSMVDIRKKMHKEFIKGSSARISFLKEIIPYRSNIEQMGVMRAPLPFFDPAAKETRLYKNLWNEIKAVINAGEKA